MLQQRQWMNRNRLLRGDRAIDMREQIPPARWFPPQLFEIALGKGHQHEVVLAGKMPRRRLAHLVAGGQVDEAIGMVHGGAFENAVPDGSLPSVSRQYLVEESHGADHRPPGPSGQSSAGQV